MFLWGAFLLTFLTFYSMENRIGMKGTYSRVTRLMLLINSVFLFILFDQWHVPISLSFWPIFKRRSDR
ncbi:hypothetical protein BCR42DRAFT_407502 [Absidia repens]|uniref:Uncharacterized protein n=1 Tax=Absidia repens TaxID=90262 RepID=A0A1X2ISC2_9FUNG|nr:hypothetical protein BCR42DRAFT_407502 [Absidia repens]